MSVRGDIERAVIRQLAPLTTEQGGYLALVGHYNGELDGEHGLDDMQRRLSGAQPAVLVTTSRAVYEVKGTSRSRARVTLDVFVVVVSAHLASREARNLGDDVSVADPRADPGIYQILEDIQDLVWEQPLHVEAAGPARPVSEVFVAQAPELTAWRAHYQVTYDARLAAAPALTIHEVEHHHNLENSDPVNPVVVGRVPGDGV
jgi:phage gp37-like protein